MNPIIIHQKGIDKGLVIKRELHSRVSVIPNQEISVKMRKGVGVYLREKFVENQGQPGPSEFVQIEGKIVIADFEERKVFSGNNIILITWRRKNWNIEIMKAS
uniref:Uncharacterized protein n=1 Tax=Candidatus Kentrum sp. UNK TaxID=2126344 RepID=A0A451B5J0_9GAMM|nr:MAG: hypothetical protein BECKUNK1418G_GA0071005_12352 [Candidatus Kentron sp. UNK]VFK73546.1 MAG: hypothetical protein BECKUNK1418H_GA0071006_12175 [Candidatus Kentron sp. UNK]